MIEAGAIDGPEGPTAARHTEAYAALMPRSVRATQ
jgi:hypothetical protein